MPNERPHPRIWSYRFVDGAICVHDIKGGKPNHDLLAFWGCKIADVIEGRFVPEDEYDVLVEKARRFDLHVAAVLKNFAPGQAP